jgi:uncharacterized protein YndB with AHSA1/START domain
MNPEPSNTLTVTLPSDREIAMTRVFNAPRHLVFRALTTCELIKQWLTGPPGWTMVTCQMDVKVGGKFRWVWNGTNAKVMGISGVFLEVVAPERLVNTELFDEPWYEGEGHVTQVLTEENGKTTLICTVRSVSQEVRDNVLKTGMEKGVGYSYDNLAALLEKL